MAFALPARADLWYESYAKAEQALAAEKWDEAVRQINLALEQKGDSNARARTYGMNFAAYFPYLRLAQAYLQLGQLDAASQALETEERLGAISQSPAESGELARLRGLIAQARTAAADDERKRIERIVAERLGEAERLEGEGDLDGALQAVGQALAVAQSDSRATAAMADLRSKIVAADTRRDEARRADSLVAQGRGQLDARRYQDAGAAFEQALALRPTDEVRGLLDQAQRGLRAELEAEQDAGSRRRSVDEALAETRTLETAGRFGDALARLQTAFALEPTNPDALALRGSLLAAQAREAETTSRDSTVQGLLVQSGSLLEAGDFDGALSASNRVLALDRENVQAMEFVSRAYRELSQRLLGKVRLDLPPTIAWLDGQTETLADGSRAERVRSTVYKFSGTVYDEATVEVRVVLQHFGTPRPERGSPKREQPLEAKRSVEQRGAEYLSHFVVEQALRPGLSVFAVEALDPLKKGTRREYAVLYAPPFWATGWFRLALGAVVLCIPLAAWAARARRRRRLLERRFNPYVAGAPIVQDDMFFGREPLLARVLETVHNNSILLYGERRIGKTSLQHQLKRRLSQLDDKHYTFYPVFIDLQGTPQERFFATIGQEIFQELAPILNGVQPSPLLADPERYDYRVLVDDLRAVIQALVQRSPKKVKLVLLIDEVDELNSYDPRVNQRLRSLFMRNFADTLIAVVSGVGIKKHWESEGSPWYNFFEEVEVKPFLREDAVRLIERPIRGILRLEPGVTERILELAGCRPYLIQKLCVAAVNRMHAERRSTITIADVEAVGHSPEG